MIAVSRPIAGHCLAQQRPNAFIAVHSGTARRFDVPMRTTLSVLALAIPPSSQTSDSGAFRGSCRRHSQGRQTRLDCVRSSGASTGSHEVPEKAPTIVRSACHPCLSLLPWDQVQALVRHPAWRSRATRFLHKGSCRPWGSLGGRHTRSRPCNTASQALTSGSMIANSGVPGSAFVLM